VTKEGLSERKSKGQTYMIIKKIGGLNDGKTMDVQNR